MINKKIIIAIIATFIALPGLYYGYSLYIDNKEIDSFTKMDFSTKIDALDTIWMKYSNEENKIDKLSLKKQEIVLNEFRSLDFKSQRKILNIIMAADVLGRRKPTQQHSKLINIAIEHIENKSLDEQMDWAIENQLSIGYFDKMILDNVAKNVTFAMQTDDKNLQWSKLTKYIEAIKRR